jgi:WD40 repeat protein
MMKKKSFWLVWVLLVVMQSSPVMAELQVELIWQSGVHDVYDIAFSPDGSLLALGHGVFMPAITIWDMKSWRLLHTLEIEEASFIASVAFSKDGKWLVSCVGGMIGDIGDKGDKSYVQIWDVRSWQSQRIFEVAYVAETGITFFPSEQLIVDSDEDVWEMSGRNLGKMPYLSQDALSIPSDKRFAYSYNRKWKASGRSYSVEISEVKSGKLLRTLDGAAQSLAFSPNGKFFVAGSHTEIRIWEVGSWQLLHTLEQKDNVVAISPDSKWLASVSNGTLQLWTLKFLPSKTTIQNSDIPE